MQQRDILLDSIVWSNQAQASAALINNNSYPAWKENIRNSYDFLGADFKLQIEQQIAALSDKRPVEFLTGTSFNVIGCADPFHHMAHIGLHVTMMDLYLYGGTPILFHKHHTKVTLKRLRAIFQTGPIARMGVTLLSMQSIF